LSAALTPVSHRTITIDGNEIFYREAGPIGAPVVLLPHGYPSSSFSFASSWRPWVIAGG
jgi:pimeloyl-ACP methyl ester carboxylesterase